MADTVDIFTDPQGRPLLLWIEPTLRVRGPKPQFFNLIRSGGGEIIPVIRDASIIVVERGTPEARQHVENWSCDADKCIVDVAWVYACRSARRPLLGADWEPYRIYLSDLGAPEEIEEDEENEDEDEAQRAPAPKQVRQPMQSNRSASSSSSRTLAPESHRISVPTPAAPPSGRVQPQSNNANLTASNRPATSRPSSDQTIVQDPSNAVPSSPSKRSPLITESYGFWKLPDSVASRGDRPPNSTPTSKPKSALATPSQGLATPIVTPLAPIPSQQRVTVKQRQRAVPSSALSAPSSAPSTHRRPPPSSDPDRIASSPVLGHRPKAHATTSGVSSSQSLGLQDAAPPSSGRYAPAAAQSSQLSVRKDVNALSWKGKGREMVIERGYRPPRDPTSSRSPSSSPSSPAEPSLEPEPEPDWGVHDAEEEQQEWYDERHEQEPKKRKRERPTGPVFTWPDGTQVKFVLQITLKNRREILQNIKSNGGNVTSDFAESNFVLLATNTADFKSMLESAVASNKPALKTEWVMRCVEAGELVEWMDYVVPGSGLIATQEEEDAMVEVFGQYGTGQKAYEALEDIFPYHEARFFQALHTKDARLYPYLSNASQPRRPQKGRPSTASRRVSSQSATPSSSQRRRTISGATPRIRAAQPSSSAPTPSRSNGGGANFASGSGAHRGGSSPTPPSHAEVNHRGSGIKFTDEDEAYLLAMADVLMRRHPGIRKKELGDAIAERAPHRSASSWMWFYNKLRPVGTSSQSSGPHKGAGYNANTATNNNRHESSSSSDDDSARHLRPVPSSASTMAVPYRSTPHSSSQAKVGPTPRAPGLKRTEEDRWEMAEFLSTAPPGTSRELWVAFLEQYHPDDNPQDKWRSWAEHYRVNKVEIGGMMEKILANRAAEAKANAGAQTRKSDEDHFDILLPSKRMLEEIDMVSDIGSDVVCMPKKPKSSADRSA